MSQSEVPKLTPTTFHKVPFEHRTGGVGLRKWEGLVAPVGFVPTCPGPGTPLGSLLQALGMVHAGDAPSLKRAITSFLSRTNCVRRIFGVCWWRGLLGRIEKPNESHAQQLFTVGFCCGSGSWFQSRPSLRVLFCIRGSEDEPGHRWKAS